MALASLKVKQIKAHTTTIRQCVMMLENIQMLLEYRNLSTQEIIEYLHNSNSFSNLILIRKMYNSNNSDFNVTIIDAFNDKQNLENLDREDVQLLKGFFSILGRSNLEGQLSNCQLYKDFFKQKLRILEEKESTECKTKSTLITALGLVLIILII